MTTIEADYSARLVPIEQIGNGQSCTMSSGEVMTKINQQNMFIIHGLIDGSSQEFYPKVMATESIPVNLRMVEPIDLTVTATFKAPA